MVGSVESIVWYWGLLAGCLLLPVGPVQAQQPDSLVAVLYTESDAQGLDDAIEREWGAKGMWRTRVQRTASVPSSHKGGPLGVQSRLNLSHGSWSLSLFLKKSMGEPLGPTSLAPWRGPERKQVSLSLDRSRWEVHIGPFRQHVGFGLVAGRSEGWAPALSSPLTVPDILPRAGARPGSAGDPVPSGIFLLLKGPKGRIGMFHGHTWHAASIDRDDQGQWTVVGPSGTSVFATQSSVQRRRRLGMTWSGWTGAIQRQSWKLASVMGLVQATSRLQIEDQPVPLAFPGQVLLGSLSFYRRFGAWEAAAEGALKGPSGGHRWTVRWRPGAGKGIRIGGMRHADSSRSPFGADARFRSAWQREHIGHVSASWRFGRHDLVVVGSKRDRKSAQWTSRMRLAMAWSLRGGNGMAFTAFSIRERESDTQWRWGARFGMDVRDGLDVGLQTQVGLRFQPDDTRRTSALVAGGLRIRHKGWDAHAVWMRRLGGTGTTVLYAAIPAMHGGFPVLGGSSDRWMGVLRLRRHIGHRLDLESWWRWEREPGGIANPGQFHWQVQSTVRF